MTTPADGHPLLAAAVLQIAATRSSAGQTAEVRDGAGVPLAAADGAGRITDPSGAVLLHAPVAFDGRGTRGTDAKLQVSGGAGEPLGEARVVRYSLGPRASRLTVSLVPAGGGEEAARLESLDRRGEQVGIAAGGSALGTLQRVSRKRGLLRSSAEYRLELTGQMQPWLRALVLAAAIRHQALVAAVGEAVQRDRR